MTGVQTCALPIYKAQLEAQKEIDDIIKQCDKSKEDSNGVA